MTPLTPATAPAAPATPRLGNTDPAAARRTAQQFEAQALGALLQPMFAGIETKGFFGGGSAEAQWRPMLVDAIANDLARAGGLGLADAVLREITRMSGESAP